MKPPPSSSRWQQVEQVLDAALDRPPDERSQFLSTACGEDAELRDQVERLLKALEESDHFLEQAAPEMVAPILAGLAPDGGPVAPGDRIGPYRIVEEAGRGGMAVVYRAERDDDQFRQQVALKLVRPGLILDEDLLRRFREERQLLAGLDHPGIAQLVDGGVTDRGLPWFAMQFVEGTPIDAFCDAKRLPIDSRLRLFCAVCDAVAYAHRRRIVHRDLKPGNILVTGSADEGGEGAPAGGIKLLDFGIAKLLEGDAASERDRTRGARLLTPDYASPEQLSGEGVSPATDVYALGVLLYRLLCGRHPYPRREPGGSRLAHRRSRRRPPPAAGLRDLDAIILKAMSEEPERRYRDASELATEVRRHLEGGRVAARAEATRRRLRSLLQRPALMAGIGSAAVLAGIAGHLAVNRGGEAPLVSHRVVVAPFDNRTGLASLDPVSSMAADWIIQGLTRTGLVQVVPLTATLTASRFVAGPGAGFDSARIRLLADETGAGIVVSGSLYQQGDSLYLQATVTDAIAGSVLHALDVVATPASLPLAGIEELGHRVTGLLAPRFNPRTEHQVAGSIVAPPSFEAYRAHALGMEYFIAGEWRTAANHLRNAAANDSTFTIPLVYAGMALANLNERAAVDSLLQHLEPRLHRLSELERIGYATLYHGYMRGDLAADYEANRRVAEIAPGTLAHWSLSQAAGRVNRPREAIRIARQIDPERGELRGWQPYWHRLAEAYHRVGNHREELRAARRARELWPGTAQGLFLEASALAGLGRKRELMALLAEATGDLDNPVMLLRHAGLELRAHGHSQDGDNLLRQSLEWDLAQPHESPAYRRRLAHSHYLVGDLDEAENLLRRLADDGGLTPSVQAGLGLVAALRGNAAEARAIQQWLAEVDRPFQFGAHTYQRAQIAALLGDADEAVRLLRQAWQQGLAHIWEAVHRDPEFDGIRRNPAFREFVRPKG